MTSQFSHACAFCSDHRAPVGDLGHGDAEGARPQPALRLQALYHDFKAVQNQEPGQRDAVRSRYAGEDGE